MQILRILVTAATILTVTTVAKANEIHITRDIIEVTVQTAEGPVVIRRDPDTVVINTAITDIYPALTHVSHGCPPFCIQPQIIAHGVVTISEVEVLKLLQEEKGILVDVRQKSSYLHHTIPGAINIFYPEIISKLDKLGCAITANKWNCTEAKIVILFCDGPSYEQSPTAIKEMIKAGFPSERILYYRGGIQTWRSLGLTTMEGSTSSIYN